MKYTQMTKHDQYIILISINPFADKLISKITKFVENWLWGSPQYQIILHLTPR
jgi:hypothetical protein